MDRIDVPVESRTETGKGPNYRLRQAGRLPAVIYGAGGESEKVSLNYREFDRLISRADAAKSILNINNNGNVTTAVIRDIQRDPVTRRFLHVDLYRVRMDQENTFEIPVHGEGVPAGVREGGILETHLRNVEVRCMPDNLPTALTIDLTGLRLNSSIHASDLQLPQGVSLATEPGEVIFTVVAPQSGTTTGEEAPSQPEVIGKKKGEA